MNYSTTPLRLLTARNRQQDFLNGLTNWEPIVQNEDAWHRFPTSHSFVGIIWHIGSVMCQNDAIVRGCPGQDIGVILTR